MWISHHDTLVALVDGHMIRVAIANGQDPLTYAEVIQLWQSNPGFCSFFRCLLADCPFRAFRWETPPLTLAIAHRLFEFVWII